jgi:hypothetical protein
MSALCLMMVVSLTAGGGLSVEEDFSGYPDGSDGAPAWRPFDAQWEMRDGTYRVDTEAYDTGSSLSHLIEGAFTASVELMGPRAGLYFSLDARDNRACSHMIRFEGKDLMWGFFDGAGIYQATGTIHTDVDPESWRTLSLYVNPTQGTYQVMVDGAPVATGARLKFPSGYFGLQASDGTSAFRRVELAVTSGEREAEGSRSRPSLGHLGLATVDRKGRIIVTDRALGEALIITAEGERVSRYGAPACTLVAPPAAVLGPMDRLYVCDPGQGRVVVFDKDGTVAKTFRPPELRNPVAMHVGVDGSGWVVDAGGGAVHRLDQWGQVRASMGEGVLEEPVDLVKSGRRVWVSDASGAVHVFDTGSGELLGTHTARFSSPRGLLETSRGLVVADAGKGTVELLNADGGYRGSYDRSPLGPFTCPRDVINLDGHVVVVDYDRFVFLPMAEEYEPLVGVPVPGKLRVSWTSMDEGIGEVHFRQAAGEERVAKELAAGFRHSVDLAGLESSQRYPYRLRPTTRTIPPSDELSWERVLVTPPSRPRVLPYTRLPVLVLVYRTISYRDAYPFLTHPWVPAGRSLSDEELEYLDSCVLRFRDFYWRNSACRLYLDTRVAVVEDTLWLAELGDEDPYWLSPNERVTADVERQAEALGWAPEELAGVIVSYAWLNYSDDDAETRISQAVGGGTNVVPAPWKLGGTSGYSGNPFPPGSRQDWLMVHEFHHQLDALLALSGHPEYPHADQPWKLDGRFGEDYSFNAAILRTLSPHEWLAVKWGTIRETPDSDGDGLPDDDLLLPLDEARLGSDPRKVDTDDDGLSDLSEIMSGFFRGSDPLAPDTDQDGKPDLADPSPLWPIDHNCYRSSPVLDGTISDGEWHELAEVVSDELRAVAYTGWTEGEMFLAASVSDSAVVEWKIDASGDGWFHGADNIWIRYNPWGDEDRAPEVCVFDCSSWSKPPKVREDLSPAGAGRAAAGVQDGRLAIEVAVPREAGGAFQPETSLGIVLRTSFAVPRPHARRKRIDLFDETEMVPLWFSG